MSKKEDPEGGSGGTKGREPQSYGSQSDWLTGRTGQSVDDTAGKTERHDEEFYESRHDPDGQTPAGPPAVENHENQASPEPSDESADGPGKVSDIAGGRDSYFKNRDYRGS